MTEKEKWIQEKKIEFAKDRRMHTLEELGLKPEYDPARKVGQASGYFVRAKDGTICDLSDEVMATGYIYLSPDYEDVEERLEKGGRLGVGTTSWVSADV